jgi:hypothetical protein
LSTRARSRSCTTIFATMHQTLRVNPAMVAGLTDHVWELGELIALMPKPVAKAWGHVKRAAAVRSWRCESFWRLFWLSRGLGARRPLRALSPASSMARRRIVLPPAASASPVHLNSVPKKAPRTRATATLDAIRAEPTVAWS